ncbi:MULTISPECIES: CxxH/CxxC protein [Pontibacillus]|uniref:CxxH/CxxC protein n=1 Tax=Pontibacillus TaxID=289201 RepID=UPI000A456D91|nr:MULTISPECIES: CxxH/CxxC protein [Pontibacillus]
MKLFVCQDHVDRGIDVIVDECETFPDLNKLEDSNNLSTTCEYCSGLATYIVANAGSSTK